MATENEELVLVVSLDDNATVPLRKLRQDLQLTASQIQQLRASNVGAEIERFGRDSEKFGVQIRGMAESIQEMLREIPVLGTQLGGLNSEIERLVARIPAGGRVALFGGAAVAAVGVGMSRLASSLGEFSRDAYAFKMFADKSGILPGQFAVFREQLERTISPEDAQSSLEGFFQFTQQMRNENRRREFLRSGAEDRMGQGGTEQVIMQMIAKIDAGKPEEAWNDLMDQIAATERDDVAIRQMGHQQAVQRRNRALAAAHISPGAYQARLKKATQAQNDMWDRRIRLAKEYNTTWAEIELQSQRMTADLLTGILPIMKDITKWLEDNSKELGKMITGEVETDLRDIASLGLVILKVLKAVSRAMTVPKWLDRGTTIPGWASPGGPFGVDPIGDLLSGQVGPGKGNMNVPFYFSGGGGSSGGGGAGRDIHAGGGHFWSDWRRSENVEDRRNEHAKELEQNTDELKKFNNQIYSLLSMPGGMGTGQGGMGGGLGAVLGYGGAGYGGGAGTSSGGRGVGTSGGGGGGERPAGEGTKAGGFQSDRTYTVREAIKAELIAKGVPPENATYAAAAMTGQAIAESGLNPNASHDGGTGYGIYGAGRGRKTAMLKWLAENGYAPNDLKGQARYMAHEAMTKYPGVAKALTGATRDNLPHVNAVLTDQFEAPAKRNYGRRLQDTNTALAAQPPQPTTPKTSEGAGAGSAGGPKGKMIFIHGLKDRYGRLGGSVEQTEADAKRIADAKGLELVVVDNEAQAREQLKDPNVKAVTGFSAGGNAANRIRRDFPDKDYTIISADKGTPGDIQLPGGHMQQVGAVAAQLEKQKAARSGQSIVLPEVTAVAPRKRADTDTGSGTDRVTEAQAQVAGIRTQPIDPQLKASLDYAAEKAGVTVRVTSGGQPTHGPHRTGSHRHDLGRAADLDLLDEKGNKLARNDPRRLVFLRAAAEVGAGGTGAGYMSDPLKVHVGITGNRAVIGEGLGAYAGSAAEREAVAAGVAVFKQDPDRLARRQAAAQAEGGLKGVRTTIDRAQSNEIRARVEAAGKLKVSVDAPAKTEVEASTEGKLFSKGVEMNRKVQPAVPTDAL